ncbi:MAG: D-glycero-beta-D-manno-heptose 1-phosphate adenylyltransferase [Phycisphaerae bacterium]|nr:D-glycero-beta-D-manno-heptose 1-phosphate adenylyltransferase [Phycisphaerae bacterium]
MSEAIERFPGRRVLLVGDFMLDRYIFGDAERISPEAPVPVLRVLERQDRVGGAGSVALNIVALGARVSCCGLLGKDPFGDRVEKALAEAGCETGGLIRVADRPTITKTRLVGLAEHRHRQQILRVDDELVRPPAPDDEKKLLTAVQTALPDVDVICLEDYAKGVLAPDTCSAIVAAAGAAGKPVFIDPARTLAWEKYSGATLLTPNRAELEIVLGRRVADDEIASAAGELAERLKLGALLITLGRDGALLLRRDREPQRFPTTPRAVYDNTGAGDAVLAMVAVAVAAGASLEQAAMLANVAGGLEVSKFGCVPITRDEVLHELRHGAERGRGKLRAVGELKAELDALRQRGETVVFTNGCFDILHPGHLELLEQAKTLGSLLVVGLNSDASVRLLNKGDERPIRNQNDRARLLAALECVDYVVMFDEPDPGRLIEQVVPDVLVKGADWADKGVVGRKFVESRGGRVELVELVEGYSTTGEMERIRAAAART